MDSAKLNDWMQVVGIFAVVASLIFVGLQMRQDREIALAAQFQQRVETALDLWNGYAESEYDVLRFGNRFIDNADFHGIFGDETTPVKLGQAYISSRKTLVVLENHHYQYISGFYDEETWSMFRSQARNYLATNQFAQMLVRKKSTFIRPSFLELCDQLLDEIDSDEKN